MENHLFGHLKGSFTGATNNRKGLVSEADGGTLFLDEIGELPLAMQSSLLRFVQTKAFSKVGSNTVERVNVRLLCATNRNLLAEVKAGRFREDLYHRINVIEIKLPALHQRGQDILLLAKFFLAKFSEEEHKNFQGFSPEAEKKLLGDRWLGNVRQLQNVIHKAVVLNKGLMITAEMLVITQSVAPKFCVSTPEPVPSIEKNDVIRPFKEIEKEAILSAIEYCDGNVTQAAKLLEIGRTTIFDRLKRYKKRVDKE
jgi:two-component system repressor protein LuxO